jgi:hypothetical protein
MLTRSPKLTAGPACHRHDRRDPPLGPAVSEDLCGRDRTGTSCPRRSSWSRIGVVLPASGGASPEGERVSPATARPPAVGGSRAWVAPGAPAGLLRPAGPLVRRAWPADAVLTVEASSAARLGRCHSRSRPTDTYGTTAPITGPRWSATQRPASLTDDPRAVVQCSQDAGRCVAIAIDDLDRDARQVADPRWPTRSTTCWSSACSPTRRATVHAPTADSAALATRSGARRNAVESRRPRRQAPVTGRVIGSGR